MPGIHKDGNRAEDENVWWRASALLEKYKFPIYLVVIILGGFGFDFKTPHMMMNDISRQVIDSMQSIRRDQVQLKLREDASYNDRVDQRLMLEALVRVQCSGLSYKEQMRLGLPCADVANPTAHHIAAQIRAPGEIP